MQWVLPSGVAQATTSPSDDGAGANWDFLDDAFLAPLATHHALTATLTEMHFRVTNAGAAQVELSVVHATTTVERGPDGLAVRVFVAHVAARDRSGGEVLRIGSPFEGGGFEIVGLEETAYPLRVAVISKSDETDIVTPPSWR
jgi:hypothetical protein